MEVCVGLQFKVKHANHDWGGLCGPRGGMPLAVRGGSARRMLAGITYRHVRAGATPPQHSPRAATRCERPRPDRLTAASAGRTACCWLVCCLLLLWRGKPDSLKRGSRATLFVRSESLL
jgi:hypothetical protein